MNNPQANGFSSFDREGLEEYREVLTDLAPKIERDIALLRKHGEGPELIDSLFRAIHNLKGDASLCKFPLGVALMHPVETLISRFRAGEIGFSALMAEAILLALDRLELATEGALRGVSLENLKLGLLKSRLEQLADSSIGQLDAASAELIEAVTGFPPVTSEGSLNAGGSSDDANAASRSVDLELFRSFALQLENRSQLFRGRTARILRLALETNKIGNSAVDPVQLEAAVYMHDIGMMFLPERIWLKTGGLSEAERQILHSHPSVGASILERIPGWLPAAKMVAQHHETPEGTGYPSQSKSEAICPGAKILAIVDAFEAVMLKHSHRGKNRSVLRAIAEINACDKQFAPEWIAPFNTVIRKTIEN